MLQFRVGALQFFVGLLKFACSFCHTRFQMIAGVREQSFCPAA
ncbi:MAG TPA: hypothetical protein VH350_18705 [Candidatus Sulfotelmatobacter sp.]|nr:hypothetical protein [Candidatus Sulfotelmatobacter sp.]